MDVCRIAGSWVKLVRVVVVVHIVLSLDASCLPPRERMKCILVHTERQKIGDHRATEQQCIIKFLLTLNFRLNFEVLLNRLRTPSQGGMRYFTEKIVVSLSEPI